MRAKVKCVFPYRGDLIPTYYHDKDKFKIIPQSEVRQMLDATADLRMKALVSLAWITGARLNELMFIRHEDIKIDDEYIEIRLNTLKGGSPRRIKLNIHSTPFLYNVVIPYLNSLKPPSFITFDTKTSIFPFGKRRAQQLLQEINKKTGFWYTFHEFRHSRITYLARELNATTYELMMWTGWKTDNSPAYIIRSPPDRFMDNIK